MESTTGQVYVEMPACEAAMFQKMPTAEPRFTLRAQDASADLTVMFWVRVNAYLKRAVASDKTVEDAWMLAADRLAETFPLETHTLTAKERDALHTAEKMHQWTPRKLPD